MSMICSFICPQTLYASASSSSSAADKDVQLKSHYDQVLLGVQKELEIQKDQVTRSLTASTKHSFAFISIHTRQGVSLGLSQGHDNDSDGAGFELPTFWLSDDPLYHCPTKSQMPYYSQL